MVFGEIFGRTFLWKSFILRVLSFEIFPNFDICVPLEMIK